MGRILIVDKDQDYCDHVHRFLSGADHSAEQTGDYQKAIRLLEDRDFDVVISGVDALNGDIRAFIREAKSIKPQASVIVAYPEPVDIIPALGDTYKLVFRALQKPIYDAELHFQVKRALEDSHPIDRRALMDEADEEINLHSEFIGQSPAIRKIFRILGRVAKTDASVIILGETGTGKELAAWTLHKDSLRSSGPFVKVNCAALPEQLLESELFGYERGAFTGADRTRVGRFEAANHGTIFLDEVADMSLVTQAKLLRVLQQKEFERLGSNLTVKIDVRIVSATNKDLMELMRKGLFREDLFYRLNVICVRLPPLRDRGGDISLLLDYFLKRSISTLRRRVRGFSSEAIDILTNYRWPGNIREMENTLERAVLMTEGDTIGPEDLDLIFADYQGEDAIADTFTSQPSRIEKQDKAYQAPSSFSVILPPNGISLAEAERELLLQALERCGGSQKKAAELLGVSGRVLNYKIMNMRKEAP